MREHHPLGVAALAQRHDCRDPLLEGQQHVDAEPIHAEQEAGIRELSQVVEVDRVT